MEYKGRGGEDGNHTQDLGSDCNSTHFGRNEGKMLTAFGVSRGPQRPLQVAQRTSTVFTTVALPRPRWNFLLVCDPG